MNLLISFFIALFFIQCRFADANSKLKTYQIEDYTGFISRDFFQVVVEIPLEINDKPILEQRKACKLQAIQKRNELTLPILKSIALENSFNKKEYRKNSTKIKEKEHPSFEYNENLNIKPKLYTGEFAWFLEGLFPYKEDYSEKNKCKFIYRNISENLYAKVEETQLIFPDTLDIGKSPSSQGSGTILPSIPTGASVR